MAPLWAIDADQAPPTPHPSFDSEKIRLPGVKVLVVDDEPDARALLKQVLCQCEAEVTTAETGTQGLELIRARTPDVIVSDIGMPGMDGYEFMRQVRATLPPEKARIPAIALTAYARSEDRTKAMLAGYQIHLSKPIEPQELVVTVGSLVHRIQ
jgi:CheY-like chemotaxis protein